MTGTSGRTWNLLVAARFLPRRGRPSVSLCGRRPLQRTLAFNKIRAKRNGTQIYAGLRRLFKGTHSHLPGKHSSAGRSSLPASGTPRGIQVLASREVRGETPCGVTGQSVRWLSQGFRPGGRPPWPAVGPWRAKWKGKERASSVPQVGSARDFTPGYSLSAASCVLLTAYF